MTDFNLMQGDCLELMQSIPEGSVDMVLTDPPYGTTACKWDTVIDLDAMWAQLKRIVKSNCAIVMTASQPFTSALIMSNPKMFRYCWVWDKGRGYNFASLKYQPFKSHEDVVVFSIKSHKYYPIKTKGTPYTQKQGRKGDVYGGDNKKHVMTVNNGDRHPLSIQKFVRGSKDRGHPTQKPVALMEYMIRTYTNEGDTVLDFTMGSGSTGVACANLSRSFIGIELDADYFDIAEKRIQEARNDV